MSGKRIELIEDDEAQREVRAMLLEMQGYEVAAEGGPADLVLMDLRIPTVEAGLEKIRSFQERQPVPKVVVLSGAVEQLETAAERQMVDAVLEKPCPTGKLLRTLEALLALLLLMAPLRAQTPDIERHSPILYQRVDTIGTESDVPLLLYCEHDKKENSLTYTVVFSNEDGGTSTRSLMARWGRTADIEYVYKVWLKPDGSAARREIQTRDHKDVEFQGPFEGDRPVLEPVTRNNMVDGAKDKKGRRYDVKPVLVDLSQHSREYVLDQRPDLLKIIREELFRENKIRPYGQVRGEDISDPNNYAVIEMKATQQEGGRIAWGVVLFNQRVVMSHLGILSNTIERSGWMRSAIELPPAVDPKQIEQVVIACYGKGSCRVDRVNFVSLRDDYRQVPLSGVAVTIPAGEQRLFRLGL